MMAYSILLLCWHDLMTYLFQKSTLVGRCVKWQVLLSQYDFTCVTQKFMKGKAMVDLLADLPLPKYQPLEMRFSDEDVLFAMEEQHRSEDHEEMPWW